METKKVNDWFNTCHVEAKVKFCHEGGGNFPTFSGLTCALKQELGRTPWMVKRGKKFYPAEIRVGSALSCGDFHGEFELSIGQNIQFSQLFAFQKYLTDIVQRLADRRLPKVSTIAAWFEIQTTAVYGTPTEVKQSA